METELKRKNLFEIFILVICVYFGGCHLLFQPVT